MRMKVQENEHLVRDSQNFAILNTDKSAIDFHKQKMIRISKERVHDEQINKLKSEISEIKDMLSQLLKQKE